MSCYSQLCPRSETWICRVCPGPTWPHTALRGLTQPWGRIQDWPGPWGARSHQSSFWPLGGSSHLCSHRAQGQASPGSSGSGTCVLLGAATLQEGWCHEVGHGAGWPEPQRPHTHYHTLLQKLVSIELSCGYRDQRVPGMCRAWGSWLSVALALSWL